MNRAPDLNGYFERIGYDGPQSATLDTLRAIALRHALTIPFENLSPLLRQPVPLDLVSLEQKLVRDRRGGYCFEHNTLLSSVLEALGFRVTGLAARVRWNVADEVVTPRGHMLLRVDLQEGAHIVDVGFGGLTLTGVLRLEPEVEQPTPHERFRLVAVDEWLELQARVHGLFKPIYRFTRERQFPVDYQVSNYFLSTSPSSHFLQNLMVARPFEGGRYALANNVLSIHHLYGRPSERHVLPSPRELRDALEGQFGLRLAELPGLDALLARLTAAPA